jgi:hypothetical protein
LNFNICWKYLPVNINIKLIKIFLDFILNLKVSNSHRKLAFFQFNLDNKWKQVGLTIVGRSCRADNLNLCFPQNTFIDDDQTVYIVDRGNHRIVEWKSNANNGRIVAGGNGKGNKMNQLNYPRDVIIDKENNCFIISDNENRRVMRWSRQNNTNGQIIISDIDCSRLTMDKDGSLYVSD